MTVALGLTSGSCLWGELNDPQARNYEVIIKRNAFGLKDMPPPQMPIANPPTNLPPLNIKFTGITSWGGLKKAYFMIPDTTKPGTFLYPSLREGERDGALEVLEINEQLSTVKVRNADRELVLDFKTYGNNNPGPVAAIAGPQAGPARPGGVGAPGAPGAPGGIPKPNVPGMFPVPAGQPMATQMPNAPQASVNPSFAPLNNPNLSTGGLSVPTSVIPRTTTIPTRTIRAQASLPEVPTHTLEESAAKIMIQNQIAQPLIQSGEMPPLPPIE